MIEIKHKFTGVVLLSVDAANLSGADLSWANLSWANLSGADLSGADLSGADLRWANLRWANLSGANLRGADLRWANLRWANLSGANLSGANLSGADLSGADLSWANLSDGTTIISVSGIGSSRRLSNYWFEIDRVWCGCFVGTLDEFAAAIEKTHADNALHLNDYRAVVAMLRAVAAARMVSK